MKAILACVFHGIMKGIEITPYIDTPIKLAALAVLLACCILLAIIKYGKKANIQAILFLASIVAVVLLLFAITIVLYDVVWSGGQAPSKATEIERPKVQTVTKDPTSSSANTQVIEKEYTIYFRNSERLVEGKWELIVNNTPMELDGDKAINISPDLVKDNSVVYELRKNGVVLENSMLTFQDMKAHIIIPDSND